MAWAVLALVGITLIGFIVRGFFVAVPRVEATGDRVEELLRDENRRAVAGNLVVTLLGVLAAAIGLFALYWFWGIGLAAAAALIMVARLPDLLWEVRTGQRVSRRNAPGGLFRAIATFLLLVGSLPLVWYSLCREPS